MFQQSPGMAALAGDPGSSPTTHMAAPDHLELQFQGSQHLPLSFVDTAHTWNTYICLGKTVLHIRVNK